MDKKRREKYKNAVLYLSSNLNSYQLGSTKLAKILYYFDFISYRDRKKSITGTTYYKQEFGPLAKDLVEVIGELVDEKKLEVRSIVIPKGNKEIHNYKSLKKTNIDVFNEYEKSLLRKLTNKYAKWPTEQVVGKSHLEAPWVMATEGGPLNYKYAFDIDDFDDKSEKDYEKEDKATIEALRLETSC